ncbi:bleomycin resistance protein [Xenorhabdus bharatensis]|uniref:bleomycin resistance protein n=1 Tax=Xenorhabdus bharatensis TaxID=3136256 RepID=UPI0030F449B8
MSSWEAVPVLAALDMNEMIQFYTERLGFTCDSQFGDQYGIVSRGNTELHFWSCDDKYIAENTSCYIYVENIQEVFDELKDQVEISDIKETSWGGLEMYLFDPSGNLLKFGQVSSD